MSNNLSLRSLSRCSPRNDMRDSLFPSILRTRLDLETKMNWHEPVAYRCRMEKEKIAIARMHTHTYRHAYFPLSNEWMNKRIFIRDADVYLTNSSIVNNFIYILFLYFHHLNFFNDDGLVLPRLWFIHLCNRSRE